MTLVDISKERRLRRLTQSSWAVLVRHEPHAIRSCGSIGHIYQLMTLIAHWTYIQWDPFWREEPPKGVEQLEGPQWWSPACSALLDAIWH